MELHCTLEKDGSFTVGSTTGEYLRYCYPGVDGHALRVLHVEQNEDSILWDTGRGRIGCRVENREKDSFELVFFLEDCRMDIHTLYLMYQADLTAEGFYQAAEGMGKDTGYLAKESLSGKHTVMSYGLCSVNGNGGALTIYQTAQEHYQTVFELRTERKNQYTDGSGQRNEMQQRQLSCGIRMENTGRQNEKFASVKFLYTRTMEEGLERAAKEIGENMSARLAAPPAYHWCSWYYCYHNFDTAQLAEYLQGLQEMKDRPDLKYFQIDAGYFPSAGDWLEVNERFPEGLRSAFARIREAGYVPGIWVGAFMVGNRSRLYREHPDWILYDLAGNPIRPWITDNEPKPWGYQDEEYYCLDTSHPDAMAYMRHVFTTLREWGAGMFKTDFMLWGLQDSSRVKRHTPGKTSVEYFREFLQMIRESIGEESYWLGCIAPFIPFVGYADAMRIAGDVGSAWNGEFGPQNMMRCLTGNNYINHNYFQTDPDAVMLRAEWMYDYYLKKSNYFMNILNAKERVSFSSGQFRGITYLKEVAENMEKVITLPGGIYNFGSETTKSMYDITQEFIALLGKKVKVEDIPAGHNLWMNCDKAKKYGVTFRTVMDGLIQCAEDYNLIERQNR